MQALSRLYVRLFAWQRRTWSAVEDWHDDRLHNLNQRTFVILLVLVSGMTWVYTQSIRPPENFPTEQYVSIVEGSSLTTLADSLEQDNIVRDAWWLKAIVRLRGGEHSVKAGDYLFARPVSAFEIARRITTGAFGLEPIAITIPEGATVADMTIIFGKRLFKFDEETFFKNAIELEGYLYPDTYHFLPNAREDEVIRAMRDNFITKIGEFKEEIASSKYSLHEVLTLASIIEKEAWKENDRHLISGVLHNRLDIGMRLQVDATFFYTHDKGTYDITLAELRDEDNPYNTYAHAGLPPGPIAAVGHSSIAAALRPTENDYLFYLADRSGNTYYSATYAQHLAKKRQYVD